VHLSVKHSPLIQTFPSGQSDETIQVFSGIHLPTLEQTRGGLHAFPVPHNSYGGSSGGLVKIYLVTKNTKIATKIIITKPEIKTTRSLMDALSIIAFILALLAIFLVVPLAILLSVKNTYSYRPYFIIINEGLPSTKTEVVLNGPTTIYIQQFQEGEISLIQGRAGKGDVITLTNSSTIPVQITTKLIVTIPEEYRQNKYILVPPRTTFNFVLQTGERMLFLGHYSQ